jgi:hypothetical protein
VYRMFACDLEAMGIEPKAPPTGRRIGLNIIQ